MTKEFEILNEFLIEKNLRPSHQREMVLREFLSIKGHITAEELYDQIKKRHPGIGSATVLRSLKLFSQCGLAREVRLGNKKTYYEHSYGREHHDHLICLKCGRMFEFLDHKIERLQENIARKFDFSNPTHTLIIHGFCSKCR